MTYPIRISITPIPPRQGSTIEVCYDFSQAGFDDVSLSVGFDPPTGSVSVHLTTLSQCATVAVPDDARDVLVVDQSGTSADVGAIVHPPL